MILFHGLNWTRWEQIVNNTPLPLLTSFVEDRLATLKNVIKEPELDGWSLYLGDLFIIDSLISLYQITSLSISPPLELIRLV